MAEIIQFVQRSVNGRDRMASDIWSLRSDLAYARHNHNADRAFWIGASELVMGNSDSEYPGDCA